MRVEAHLHIGRARRGETACMSVRNLPSGKVYYAERVYLSNASFAVQPAGRNRFLTTGQKNVHAYVRGTKADFIGSVEEWREASYNPMKNETFIDKEHGFPVHKARFVLLSGKKVFYLN